MIDTRNPAIYEFALEQLEEYAASTGGGHKGRFIQIFLGIKFFQDQIPSMFSGQFIESEVLQTLLDDLYSKTTRPANNNVLVLFGHSYLARTGIVGPGNSTAQNTWRNNFNLQKGVGCYASPAELASSTFLSQSRSECRHLIASRRGSLKGGRCGLVANSATYRAESHSKWLRIDAAGGYAVVDFMNTPNFIDYIAPRGNRIPALPLMIALYHDAMPSLVIGTRAQVDLPDFSVDFNFTALEVQSYFDIDPANRYNAALLRRFPGISYSQGTPPRMLPRTPRRRVPRTRLSAPVLSGTQVPPPMTNSGWHAQEYAAAALRAAGWTVYDVSRQQLGYDLHAQRGRETRYIDAKSSLGFCRPSLTAREWQQAQAHGANYLLAIIENFNPTGQNTVYWVPDPANNCNSTPSVTTQYAIPRSSWQSQAILLRNM